MSDSRLDDPLLTFQDDPFQTQVRAFYAALHFEFVTLAIQLFLCSYGASHYKTTPEYERKYRRPYCILSFIILGLSTFSSISDSVFLANMTINYTGSAVDFWITNYNSWYGTMGTICNTLVALLGDGVLVYRCYHIWPERRRVVLLPSLILLTSLAFAILTMVATANYLSENLLALDLNTLGSVWISLSVAANCIATALIAGKLIYERRRLSTVLDAPHLTKYTVASAILVESAMPLALFGIATAVVFRRGENVALIAIVPSIWFCLSALCPQLIIFRVAVGTSYHGRTTNSDVPKDKLPAMQFSRSLSVPEEPSSNSTI